MKRRPPTSGPIVVERHDCEGGAISYELWGYGPNTYHRLCTLSDDDNRHAKRDAELLARAANNLLGIP
jgi:hypothetical protein